MTRGLLTPSHILILLTVVLLLFGAKRLPETGRALGRSMREFKDAITGREDSSEQIPGLPASAPTVAGPSPAPAPGHDAQSAEPAQPRETPVELPSS